MFNKLREKIGKFILFLYLQFQLKKIKRKKLNNETF